MRRAQVGRHLHLDDPCLPAGFPQDEALERVGLGVVARVGQTLERDPVARRVV